MAEAVCPVCGGEEWDLDYDQTADGTEVPGDRCSDCGWPPNTPMSPQEYFHRIAWQGAHEGAAEL